MAIAAGRVTVTTSATSLMVASDVDGTYGSSITVRNAGAASVFLGGATVTTSTGFELEAGATLDGNLVGNDRLFAIGTESTICHVLLSGV